MNTQIPPEMAAGAWQELVAEAAQQAAQDKPLLLKLLAAQTGAALAVRYALWKERLARLRPGERRRLRRRLGVSLTGAALLLALAAAPGMGASAASITVDQTSGVIAVDNTCSLAEAINNANGNSQFSAAAGECATGSGADTIYLDTDVTLTASHNSTYGPTGLPVVTSAITIEGNGKIISRDSGAPTFRILAVGSGGDLTLNTATVSGGVATGSGNASRGGGIYASSGAKVTVTVSTLSDNSASYFGGGIVAYSATVTVSNSTLSSNWAGFRGGGIWSHSAPVAVTNSTLSGNSAGQGGGGIYAFLYATVSVTNSTLSGNSASYYGGGIAARNATVTVTNSTLSGNSATFNGGGIYASFSAAVTVSRSLVSGNTAASGREVYNVYNDLGTITAASFNLFGHSGESNAQAFSSFAPSGSDITATSDGSTPTALASILNTTLANNGTQPHPFTYALVSGSPAIDKAPNAACTSAPTNNVDQRGGVRNVDGNSSASSNECDIGAFEYLSTQTPNAIGLREFAAANGAGGGLAGMLAAAWAGLGGLGLSAFVARRRSRRRRGSGTAPSLLPDDETIIAVIAPADVARQGKPVLGADVHRIARGFQREVVAVRYAAQLRHMLQHAAEAGWLEAPSGRRTMPRVPPV